MKSRILYSERGDNEPNCFMLAQGLLRCGQTPFSSVLTQLGWRLVNFGWRTGGEGYQSVRCRFGDHSLLLCFGVSLREVVFKLVARPLGTTAASIPRGVTQIPGYVKDLKLVWFGDFKNQFGFCYFGVPGRLSSKCFSDTSMIRCGDWRTGRGCLLPVIRIFFF
jgi:hypothetical protein